MLHLAVVACAALPLVAGAAASKPYVPVQSKPHFVRRPTSPDDTFCDLVNDDLPSECNCGSSAPLS
jgi:hypothetical protein